MKAPEMDLTEAITELYRRMSCLLPADVADALARAKSAEQPGSIAAEALDVILENARLAAQLSRPMCQDTGLPVFYVERPAGITEADIREPIISATRRAVDSGYLRPNAVDPITGDNSGDNVGVGFPIIHIQETASGILTIDAMLKGGGCENVGERYKLPDDRLDAARDLDGVKRCVLDAVHRAQGRACPPYVVGVAIGGARDATAALAKKQLLRKIDDHSPIPKLATLEDELLRNINQLGIGPSGMGGRATALAVKTASQHRHCACFFVEVSFGCWAMRRGRLTFDESGASYE